jgi:hypothetical protein
MDNKTLHSPTCTCAECVKKRLEIAGLIPAPEDSIAWHGNQYFDPKKKKWRDGKKPKRIKLGSRNNWIWGVLTFVIISLAVTLIVNYLRPGSTFSFFMW